MFCFDTDVLVDYLRGNPAIIKQIEVLYEKDVKLFTTFINLAELYKGIYASTQPEVAEKKIFAILSILSPLQLSLSSCRIFGREWNRLKKLGTPTQQPDLLVASIAIASDITLVTRNKKHYEHIEGLKFDVW